MRLLLLNFAFIMSTLFVGSVIGQDAQPLAGKTFDLEGYMWEFKENGIVVVSGGEEDVGNEGKYEQEKRMPMMFRLEAANQI